MAALITTCRLVTLALVALAPVFSLADDSQDIVARTQEAASLARDAELRGWAAAGRAEAKAARARDLARQARELEAVEASIFVFDDDRYVGEALEGEPNGLGVWYFDDGSRYEGEFVNRAFHGLGVLVLRGTDGYDSRYEGEFVADTPHGYGIWQWWDQKTGRDGDREAGFWIDGELDGAFTYLYLEGDFAGTVIAGELEAGSQIGHGVADYSDAVLYPGSRYEGALSGHYAHGLGLWRYADGSTTYGRWIQDEVLEDESVTIGPDGEITGLDDVGTIADSTSEEIRQVQDFLIALGYLYGPADGVLGPATTDAVSRFQTDHGLQVTSSVSSALIDQLRVAHAAGGSTERPPSDDLEISAWGTGFVVSDAGHLLTNHHVVEGCDAMRVRDLGWAEVVATDDVADLALIALEGSIVPGVVSFRSWPPVVMGEAVVVFGFPEPELLSASGNATTGVVSALEGGAGFDFHQYQFSAPIQSGNSGGPLLDGTGNVIGVVVASYDGLQAANFAVKGEIARSFLVENGLQPDVVSGKAAQPRPTEDIIAEAQRHTFQLECWTDMDQAFFDEEDGPIDFGVDDLNFGNFDGECDDPRFVGDGMSEPTWTSLAGGDASDCRTLFEAGTIRPREPGDTAGLDFGDDSGEWANDGECDDPSFHGPGTSGVYSEEHLLADASDCRDAFAAGTIRLWDG